VFLNYDATLANSFDAAYEMMFGSDAALMVRDDSAWMFKEVDSPLLGWEVYAKKQLFYKETGIVIKAGSSKSVPTEQAAEPKPFTKTPLSFALTNFLRNTADAVAAAEDYIASFGADDADGLGEQISKVQRRAGATYLEGYQATVASIKANEAILKGARIELKPELFELG
jgi:hypothetical protein